MKLASLLLFAFLSLNYAKPASAINIETVPIGNPGNTGSGAVSYRFRMGKYEVTNEQYVEFLNAVDGSGSNALRLYSFRMKDWANGGILLDSQAEAGAKYQLKPGYDSFPVVYVDWYDAARFANWMHNGQGSGDTETGTYTFGPLDQFAAPIDGELEMKRNPGATWFLPTRAEWRKAAKHKNNGVTDDYWSSATSADSLYSAPPPGDDAPDASNAANTTIFDWKLSDGQGYNQGFAVTGSNIYDPLQRYLTEVGSYSSAVSPYGTFDQAGNVKEWLEFRLPFNGKLYQTAAGSSWLSPTSGTTYLDRDDDANSVGFRIASVPEPSTVFLGALALFFPTIFWRCFAATWRKKLLL